MRTEKEMFQLILDQAEKDSRVLAVGMNGSRTNNQAPNDQFQDYDIVYIVDSIEEFINDTTWIDVFGPRLIMQMPEDMVLFPPERNGRFTYLMLFEDGNRIDLILCPKEQAEIWNERDRLAKILLDKSDLLPKLPEATDEEYWIKKPSEKEFLDCCNQFWWVSTYVVKGLCRNELFYAADHLNEYCRLELLRLLSWQVGENQGYHFSIGKNYKYLPNYLTKKQYEKLRETMDVSSISTTWKALMSLQKQFSYYAQKFSQEKDWSYDQKTAKKVMDYTRNLSQHSFFYK
ncbi:aminoglycoside 6-adenylyltransferase [Candidatus Enterococcus mansonii]|uniref:Aminoglycoside 6-adenylyltransferase n=1 Tax=Candidatus Enterococcus mansonii TaxID=1834181 RepID=A0A242C6Y1_9ENTE|nr:aminoglycoside 6-adenylyltransferase [Enterococcus sp. 4G2_DIV0659]OTO05936.1 hypothetical protein A5880_003111 [Enterococcus sp. 4G2_DIV0659]